ncbi:unnamed protein product [Ilex paraguariensis]|uniref:Alkyl transferase n=1 Tax=Ilex paraguariensis TaxID=185542 RepID=A0ABC8T6D9_9AQUA
MALESKLKDNSTRMNKLYRFGMGLDMKNNSDGLVSRLFGNLVSSMRKFLFRILSVGPIPNHLAFILDGNRRYAKKWNLQEETGYKCGFWALMPMLKYCYELGVTYVTIYAFSIDNFKRGPKEVQCLMGLMQEKIEGLLEEESIVHQFGVRVHFIGNLKLLPESVKVGAEKVMKATANNNKKVLLICVAYTSTDEIVHAAQESCQRKWDEIREMKPGGGAHSFEISNESQEEEERRFIKLVDLEQCIYMGVAPDPDILFRTAGETRLSNFLLWQTPTCLLYSPGVLFPEIGLRHLVWAVLNFQRAYSYVEKKKKQL